MAIGQSGALNYEINPFQQAQAPQAQVPGGIAPPDTAEIPQNSRFANREKVTAELFNNYKLLDSFAKDMARKGIDVFTPDYTQEGGGLPYQTFLKMDAGVRFAANKLANEQKAQEKFIELAWQNKAGLAPGVSMSNADLAGDPSQVVSYEPMYATEEANRRLAQQTDTRFASNAVNAGVMNPAIARIDAMIQAGQLSPQQGAIEKSKIFANTPNPPVFQPRADSGAENKTQGSLELLKAITNQAAGNWTPGTFEQKIIGGKRQQVSTRFSGEKLGDQQIIKTDKLGNEVPVTVPVIIKDWIRDPSTGAITIRFTDEAVPDKTVDAHTGEEIATSIIASNPKYGGSAAVPELFAKAKELGFLDETNKLIPQTQITNPEIGKLNVEKTPTDIYLEQSRADIDAAIANTDEKIASFKIPTGTIKVDKNEDLGLHIYNWKQLGFPSQPTNLTPDDIYNYLDEFGYFSKNAAALKGQPAQKPTLNAEQKKRTAELKAKYGIQ